MKNVITTLTRDRPGTSAIGKGLLAAILVVLIIMALASLSDLLSGRSRF